MFKRSTAVRKDTAHAIPSRVFLLLTTGALSGLTASTASAHLNPLEHGSFLAGFSHPLTGLDHIAVMVAVGLWAATIGGRALWVVPLSFVATMCAGFGLALAGVHLPFVEPTILASVVALGLLVAAAVRLPVPAAAGIVAVFALFHGHAHGSELGAAGAATFGIGFALATAALHALGIALGLGVSRYGNPLIVRSLGLLSAAAGVILMIG